MNSKRFQGSLLTYLLFSVETCNSLVSLPFQLTQTGCLRLQRRHSPFHHNPFQTINHISGKFSRSMKCYSQKQPEDNVISFQGAGTPRPDLPPDQIPSLLMTALKLNDIPDSDSGLRSMWAFAGGNTHYIFKHNITEFIESAHETANTLPTSFYGVAMNAKSWEMEGKLNRVGGDDGWIATQVMRTVCSDGRVRRWQWELRKNKRPPQLGCWFVDSIASSDRRGNFEAD